MLLASNAFADIKTGLIAHYKLDDNAASTTAIDSSSSANNATCINNSSTYSVNGMKYKAFNFTHTTNDTCGAGNLGLSGDLSISMCAWTYYDEASNQNEYRGWVGNSTESTNLGVCMTHYAGRPAIDFFVNRWRTGTTIPVRTWAHVCGTKTPGLIGSTSALYINGALVSGAVEGSNVAPNTTNSAIRLGGFGTGAQILYRWKGYIDDIRIYNRALTAADVLELYNSSTVIRNATLNGFTVNP